MTAKKAVRLGVLVLVLTAVAAYRVHVFLMHRSTPPPVRTAAAPPDGSRGGRVPDALRQGPVKGHWEPAAPGRKPTVKIKHIRASLQVVFGGGRTALHFNFAISLKGDKAEARAGGTPVHFVLFRGGAEEGPYEEVSATALELRPGVGHGSSVSDSDAAKAGRNHVFYRISLYDGNKDAVLDLPPVRVPVLCMPRIEGSTLAYEPVVSGDDPVAGSGVFVIDKPRRTALPPVIPLGTPGRYALPFFAKDLRCCLTARCAMPFLDGTPDGCQWVYRMQDIDLKWFNHQARDAGLGSDSEPFAVFPSLQTAYGDATRAFVFLPSPTAFGKARVYWAEEPQSGKLAPIAPYNRLRKLVAEFRLQGEGQTQRVWIKVPPLPTALTARARRSSVLLTWDGAAFGNLEHFPEEPGMRLYRDSNALGTVPATAGKYVDADVEYGTSHSYHMTFVGRLDAEVWVREQGCKPMLVDTELPLGEHVSCAPAAPRGSAEDLVIGLARSRFGYSGTGMLQVQALHGALTKLLTTPGVRVLDDLNLPAFIDELCTAAANLDKPMPRPPVDPRYYLWFSDKPTRDGRFVYLWITDAVTGKTTGLGHAAVGDDLARQVDSGIVGPLSDFLSDLVPEAPAAAGTPGAKPTSFVVGRILPVEQAAVVWDTTTIMDRVTVALAEHLPDAKVLGRQQMAALRAERALLARDATDNTPLLAGDVLLSGEAWTEHDGETAVHITATAVATGEILGSWTCARCDATALRNLATWCGALTLRGGEAPRFQHKGMVRRFSECSSVTDINPQLPSPSPREVARHNRSGVGGVRPGADRADSVVRAARKQWSNGKQEEAIRQLEDVWLQRDKLASTDEQRWLPVVAAQLANWYRDRQEFEAEIQVLEWVVKEGGRNPPLQFDGESLCPEGIEQRLMRAKLKARAPNRAKELADGRQTRPSAAQPASETKPVGKQTAPARKDGEIGYRCETDPGTGRQITIQTIWRDGKQVDIPTVRLGLPLPPELDWEKRDSAVRERESGDPLILARAVVSRDHFTLDEYATHWAEYIAADYRVYQQGVQDLQNLRHRAAAAGLDPEKERVYLVFSGRDARIEHLGKPDDHVPRYNLQLNDLLRPLYGRAPYLMSHIVAKLPEPIGEPFLSMTCLRHGGVDDETLLGDYLLAELLAQRHSKEGVARKQEVLDRARKLRQELDHIDLAKTKDDVRLFMKTTACRNALLVLAYLKDAEALTACKDPRYLSTVLFPDYRLDQGVVIIAMEAVDDSDVLRLLLDRGCTEAIPFAAGAHLTGSSNGGFRFFWRSADELEQLTTTRFGLLSRDYMKELRWYLRVTDEECDRRIATDSDKCRRFATRLKGK